ncbi:hypothetical protein VTK26DRAFT_8743 [Humicola hyalothermophila]
MLQVLRSSLEAESSRTKSGNLLHLTVLLAPFLEEPEKSDPYGPEEGREPDHGHPPADLASLDILPIHRGQNPSVHATFVLNELVGNRLLLFPNVPLTRRIRLGACELGQVCAFLLVVFQFLFVVGFDSATVHNLNDLMGVRRNDVNAMGDKDYQPASRQR